LVHIYIYIYILVNTSAKNPPEYCNEYESSANQQIYTNPVDQHGIVVIDLSDYQGKHHKLNLNDQLASSTGGGNSIRGIDLNQFPPDEDEDVVLNQFPPYKGY